MHKEARKNGQDESLPPRIVFVLGIGFIIFVLFGSLLLAYELHRLLNSIIGIPAYVGIPYYVKSAGIVLIGIGLSFIFWVYRYRKPRDVLVSSCLTVQKFFNRAMLAQLLGRTEPFVPDGPHRFVRNPIYFGALAIVYGLSLGLASAVVFLWGIVLTLWFWFVWIPFEEKELLLLFGESYSNYQRQVPKLLPYGRKYRTTNSSNEGE